MPKVWVVRANGGELTKEFVVGGWASIGWGMGDLTSAKTLEAVREAYDQRHPGDPAAGNRSGQIDAFMNLMAAGDVIVTPALNSNVLRYGEVAGDPPYCEGPSGGHHHPNRRRVRWHALEIFRTELPTVERKTLKDRRTVFTLSEDRDVFLALQAVREPSEPETTGDPHGDEVLRRIGTKNPGFFELLVAEVLLAEGCIAVEVSGGPGDEGVDIHATVSMPFGAELPVRVQVKRYKAGNLVTARQVREFRGSVPNGAAGMIVTTSDFGTGAQEVANDARHPTITLISGSQFVEQLRDHWLDVPEYFCDQLGPWPE